MKFCMNQEGRRTAHSSKIPGNAACTRPTAGPPDGMADELSSTARRTPSARARRRNGSMTAAGSAVPGGDTR